MEIPYELIGKFLSGEASEQDQQIIIDWRNEDPANEQEYLLIVAGWNHSFNDLSKYESIKETAFEKTLKEIDSKENTSFFNVWKSMAAALLILMAALLYFQIDDKYTSTEKVNLVYSTDDSIKEIMLPDNSRIWLNSHSQLSVDENFNEKDRKLTLTGEAYFEVEKDPNKPFIIVAGESQTQVLGTAFNLKIEEQKDITLVVTEGKVAFSNEKGNIKEELIRGEKARLISSQSRIEKQKSIDSNFLAWKTRKLVFSNQSLKELSRVMSDYYKVEIKVVDSVSIQRVNITFDHQDIESALEILKETVDIEVEQLEKGVFLLK